MYLKIDPDIDTKAYFNETKGLLTTFFWCPLKID